MSELSYRAHMRSKVLTSSLRNSTIGADYIVERKHEDAVAVGIRVHSGDEDLRGRIGHRRTENKMMKATRTAASE
eukprot:scaffold5608_cov92-Skeletonema_dohrnii-CCMP3373.AAC.1